MSVGGMVCHLNDSFLMVLGDRETDLTPRLIDRTILRWLALSTPVPWPKGVPTSAAADQERAGTAPSDFERDRDTLRSTMERFVKAVDERDLVHPLFGALSRGEWGRWGYRHMDHHLRQFSA